MDAGKHHITWCRDNEVLERSIGHHHRPSTLLFLQEVTIIDHKPVLGLCIIVQIKKMGLLEAHFTLYTIDIHLMHYR